MQYQYYLRYLLWNDPSSKDTSVNHVQIPIKPKKNSKVGAVSRGKKEWEKIKKKHKGKKTKVTNGTILYLRELEKLD